MSILRGQEIGSVLPLTSALTNSSIVLGEDFKQLPATSAWKEIVGHFSFVSPRSDFLSSGIDLHLIIRPYAQQRNKSATCSMSRAALNPSLLVLINLIVSAARLGTGFKKLGHAFFQPL